MNATESGGHWRAEKLAETLNAARHIAECERCREIHRMMIGWAAPSSRVDFFVPEEARLALLAAQMLIEAGQAKSPVAPAIHAGEEGSSPSPRSVEPAPPRLVAALRRLRALWAGRGEEEI